MKKKLSLTLLILVCLFYYVDIKTFIYKRIHKGLINYDFGILSIEDLRKSDENSFPATPFDGTRIGYPYWQCFNKKWLKKFEDCKDSVFGLDIETNSEIHSYSLPHNVSTEICEELYSEIEEKLKSRTHFCIKGIDGTLDKQTPKKEYSWSFYGIKTKSGYANYRGYGSLAPAEAGTRLLCHSRPAAVVENSHSDCLLNEIVAKFLRNLSPLTGRLSN